MPLQGAQKEPAYRLEVPKFTGAAAHFSHPELKPIELKLEVLLAFLPSQRFTFIAPKWSTLRWTRSDHVPSLSHSSEWSWFLDHSSCKFQCVDVALWQQTKISERDPSVKQSLQSLASSELGSVGNWVLAHSQLRSDCPFLEIYVCYLSCSANSYASGAGHTPCPKPNDSGRKAIKQIHLRTGNSAETLQ